MSDIEEILNEFVKEKYTQERKDLSRVIYSKFQAQQATIDKLTKDLNQCHEDKAFYSEQWEKTSKRWSNELDLQLKYSEYERKKTKKLTKGLNDIKSQLFDVNNCDTILTSAIDQLLKNK